MRDFVCVKCAGKHSTSRCSFSKDHYNYRRCLVAKEQQERRDKVANSRKPKQQKFTDIKHLQNSKIKQPVTTKNENNSKTTPKQFQNICTSC